MTKLLVWWQAYKAALAGGCEPNLADDRATYAVDHYAAAKAAYGKTLA